MGGWVEKNEILRADEGGEIKVYPQSGWWGVSMINPSANAANPSSAFIRTKIEQQGNTLKIVDVVVYNTNMNGTFSYESGGTGLTLTLIEGVR